MKIYERKKFHHTEKQQKGGFKWKVLVGKGLYKPSEMQPGKKKEVGQRELPSRNNKHPYIFKGRRM